MEIALDLWNPLDGAPGTDLIDLTSNSFDETAVIPSGCTSWSQGAVSKSTWADWVIEDWAHASDQQPKQLPDWRVFQALSLTSISTARSKC